MGDSLSVPIWFIIFVLGVAVALGGGLTRLVYGEGSILNARNRVLAAELDRAESKIEALHVELAAIEITVRRLREDLEWERDENRRYRHAAERYVSSHDHDKEAFSE